MISGAVLEHFGLHFGIKKAPKGCQNTYKNKTCKYIAFLEGFRGLWAPRGGREVAGGRGAASRGPSGDMRKSAAVLVTRWACRDKPC